MENLKVKDIKYGLIALDPLQEGEFKSILHFCGYWDQPGENEFRELKRELMEDEDFGLTDIAERLVIVECPSDLVAEFIKDVPNE